MADMNPYERVLKQLEEKNAQDVSVAQQGAGSQAQQSYIDYMKSIRNLNQGLASQGITGGGSESALLGATTGYQRQKNLVAGNLASNLQGLSQNYMANRTAVESQRSEWEAQRQAQEEQRFANTITGYNTVGAVDNAIQVAQTAGETWKIGYLMAQRAAILEQERALAESARLSAISGVSGGGVAGGGGGEYVAPTTTTADKLATMYTGVSGGGYAGGGGGSW